MRMLSHEFSPCQAALAYLQRGWCPIPIPKGEKAPRIREWQNLRLTAEGIPQRFNDNTNVGVLLGEPSGWLVDIDLDTPEALQIAERFLPRTGAVFGRKSKPRSHWLYVCPDARTTRFEHERTIAEIRSTGVQTIFPPSTHPSGEQVEWASDGEPTYVDFATLKQAVAKLASCVLLAQHYPAKGTRQFASMALAGWLLRNGWSREETADFLQALCELAGDEEIRQRVAQIRNTAQKVEHDLPATGFPRLCEYYPEDVLHKVAEWLELRTERETPPKILVLDKFYPRPFTQALMSRYQFWWPGGREPIFWFDPESGLWRDDGEELIAHELRTTIEQLPDIQKRRYVVDEVVADVKECSWKEKPLPEPSTTLIPLANGVYDLEAGRLRPYQAEDYFTWKLPHRYNPSAKSKLIVPLVESFLPEDQTVTLYELMAYCLWRGYPYQKLFLLFGRGSNGKSLFAKILETLLEKDNVAHVTLGELQHGRFSGAQLHRKLANITGEVEYQEIQDTRLLKQLTGEDTIEADRKYREPIKFRNYAKLIFLTNEIPRSSDTTEAFYRRLFLIEFPKQFQENPALEVQVANVEAEEYEALLFRVLQVLQSLRERNFIFTHHKPMDEVKELYLKLSSPLHTFIEEHCEITYSEDDYIYKYEFKERFSQWLQEKGRTKYSDHRLKQEMQSLGVDEVKKGPAEQRWWAWVGIRWKGVQSVQGVQGFTTDYKPQKNCFKTVDTLDTLDTSASHADSSDFVTLEVERDTLKLSRSSVTTSVTTGGTARWDSGTGKRDNEGGSVTTPEAPFVQHITEIDRTLGPDEARRVLEKYCREIFAPLHTILEAITRPARDVEAFVQRLKAHHKRLERCTVCSHPKRREIEASLASGEPLRKVAEKFEVGRMALQRHRKSHAFLRTVTINLSRLTVTESLSRFEGTVTNQGIVTKSATPRPRVGGFHYYQL